MLTPYPADFPRESIALLLDVVRGQAPIPSVLCLHAWNVVGFVLGKTIGGGAEINVIGQSGATDEEILVSALEHPTESGVYAGIFPWGLVLQIALRLLAQYAGRA